MRSRRTFAAALVALVALAGCGGDDDDDASPSASEPEPIETAPSGTEPESTGTAPTATEPGPDAGAGPAATVSPDVPDEIRDEVGALEVQGDPLPALDGSDIASDPARGMTAPILIGQNFDGSTVRVDPAVDGPTLVAFLAHWCPHCNREVPRINELRDAGSFPDDLDIVGVSTGINPGRPNWPPSEWFEDVDWTYPVIADGVDMARGQFIGAEAYGVDGFPFLVLVDGDGKVVARWSGEREPDEFLELIEDNLAP